MRPSGRVWSERAVPIIGGGLPPFVKLREPTGHDELALSGIDSDAAAAFLDRLIEPALATGDLAASDRDMLLAMLHRGLWGDRIVSTLDCAACETPYDIDFNLSTLQASLAAVREPTVAIGSREIADGDGQRYLLPTAVEETAAAIAGDGESLAAAIAPRIPFATLNLRLEALAPIIDVDLDASCAECGHRSAVRFDIQTFTLQRLLDERESLLAEVHAIASAYGWSLEEILTLPRVTRRQFADRLGAVA